MQRRNGLSGADTVPHRLTVQRVREEGRPVLLAAVFRSVHQLRGPPVGMTAFENGDQASGRGEGEFDTAADGSMFGARNAIAEFQVSCSVDCGGGAAAAAESPPERRWRGRVRDTRSGRRRLLQSR